MLTSLMPVLPGEVLAQKYRIERLLGQGGMGVVVAAHHIDLDVMVAIKFLSIQSGGSIDRFLREARAAARVKSEHVCQVFDVGRLETGEPYIVMEHLEGTDLGEKLEREGPQQLANVASWMIQVCEAVGEAHQRGIVHRDLKPANIFLAKRSDGSTSAKVLDFGISKLSTGRGATTAQGIVGSPLYMAPEQIEAASKVDARADVWSMGVMLYELLTGELPFGGDSLLALAMTIRDGTFEPVTEVRPQLPSVLDDIVAKCLEKAPTARYASAAELALALAPFAPSDVRAIAERIGRRELVSSPDLEAAAATERQPTPSDALASDPKHAVAASSSGNLVAVGDKRTPASDRRGFEATEAAVSNDAIELSSTFAKRGPRLALVAGVLAGLVLGAVLFVVLRSPRGKIAEAANVTPTISTTEPKASPVAASAAASVAPDDPSSTTAPPVVASTRSAPTTVAATAKPVVRPGSKPTPAVSVAASVAPTPPPTATTSTQLGPKKRVELDRNDPL